MYKLVIAVMLIAGCSSMESRSFAGAELRELQKNPQLMSCGTTKVPVCRIWGGRVRKTITTCSCGL